MRPATDVDHIVPKTRGGADDLSNLQSLCHRHHSMKTARENPQFSGRSSKRVGKPDASSWIGEEDDEPRPMRRRRR